MQPDYGIGSSNPNNLATILQLQGLPPLPRSLTGFVPSGSSGGTYGHGQNPNYAHHLYGNQFHGHGQGHQGLKTPFSMHPRQGPPLPPPPPAPAPPPRPHSRRSSSSGSSFRASPDHVTNRTAVMGPTGDVIRCSPRSMSSSPSVIDSGLGRSSVETDSFSEIPRAFVRVIKSPPIIPTRLDAQLTQLKKDMIHLRQQDMALLGHLLQIHQGIQDLRNVLVQPPLPAPMTGPLPMFQSPGYFQSSSGSGSGSTSSGSRHSKHSKGHQHSSGQSKLSILSSGASKLFSRRSSTDKLMAEAMSYEVGGISHNPASRNSLGLIRRREREDDESDSLSSFEFGDN